MFGLLDQQRYRPPEVLDRQKEDYREPWKVTLTFDLRRSLDTQLLRAKAMLHECRDDMPEPWKDELRSIRKKKAQQQSFPLFVRFLDAAAAGASVGEMALIVYPDQDNDASTGYRVSKRIAKALSEARGYCDGGYFDMLA